MPINLTLERLFKEISDNFDVCFETGTHVGDGTEVLSSIFQTVISCEPCDSYYQMSIKKLSGKDNVFVHKCKSDEMLRHVPKLLSTHNVKGCVYFLDAHWSAGPSGDSWGKPSQCPLFDELKLIFEAPTHNFFIVIDDYSFFVTDRKLDPIYDPSHWPTFDQIKNILPHEVSLFEHFEQGHPTYLILTNVKGMEKTIDSIKKKV